MSRAVADPSTGTAFTAVWKTIGVHQELKNWGRDELRQFRKISSREKDPGTGKTVRWDGILLSQVLDKTLEGLPIEHRAQVDLVVLKNSSNEVAYIPRALISKYPILLAYPGEALSSASRGKDILYSVIPWSSKPKVLNEDLPLESYFLKDVKQIELANYRDRFSSLFLKRRTDPSAIRGEKLFVQNCVSCHMTNKHELLQPTAHHAALTAFINRIAEEPQTRKFASEGHPAQSNVKLKDKDRKSIIRYLEAHRLENSSQESKVVQVLMQSKARLQTTQ
jgi:hypothetical protein